MHCNMFYYMYKPHENGLKPFCPKFDMKLNVNSIIKKINFLEILICAKYYNSRPSQETCLIELTCTNIHIDKIRRMVDCTCEVK